MLNKHKLFLLCAKWIPVVTAIGILVTNTIAYYGCNDIVVDIFNFNIGTSVAGVILMYVCSYAFNFCIWHKLVITYNALIIAEALVNSVKNVIENSEIGNKLLTQQLNLIKTNKDKIIAESNRELETFKKFQIAAQANPNLTYKEFCENINNK